MSYLQRIGGYDLALRRQRALRDADRETVRAIDAEFHRRAEAREKPPERLRLDQVMAERK